MKIDNHQLRGRRMDFLMWRLTTLVVTHYMYKDGRKLNGFVLNKQIEKIVVNGITKAKTIHLEYIRRPKAQLQGWQVQSQSTLGQ